MPRSSFTIEQVLTMLAETPPRIAALTAGLVSDQLHASPNPGEWSANAVLANLRACADVWGSCIVTIIAQDRPTLRAVDPRTWIKKTDYNDFKIGVNHDRSTRTQARCSQDRDDAERLVPCVWQCPPGA